MAHFPVIAAIAAHRPAPAKRVRHALRHSGQEIEIALHRAPGTWAPVVALLEAQLVEAVQMDRPMAVRDAQRQDAG